MNIKLTLFRQDSPHLYFSLLIFAGCALAFLTSPFGGSFGRNVFYITSYLALAGFIIHARYYLQEKKHLVLPAALFLVGLVSILWTTIYKQPGDYITLYRQYQSTGRLQIAASFLLLVTLNDQRIRQRSALVAAMITGVAVNAYALYQGIHLEIGRVELNYDRATIAAYILTAVNLIFIKSALLFRTRHKIWLFALLFMVTYTTIILTGTRAAMLAYPILVLIQVLFTKDVIQRKHKIILFTALPVLLVISALVFQSKIQARIQDLKDNIAMMHETQGENSIISRLSMQTVAMKTGATALAGQSAEERGEKAKALIKQNPHLYGAQIYLTVHMHNEVLENFSIKGLFGIVSLIGLYLSLIYSAFRPLRNPALLSVGISLIIYGLSDVIFFSTEGTLLYCLAIIFSVMIVKQPYPSEDRR
ncbi:MAG: O-antigen ligase family protein [Pantoea sp.]|uniref:O-antigen ligase family protein n=1 Tax=Pantoea septica TaxID=472695 RepID=UPI000E96F86B|nr:O-antigen ligase family protein [Pantoea septica]MBU5378573.1 O-antigen ligase family protein [Pantoea septica]MDU5835734.1 O-antigen ligase family protein [Pantoea sp.]MDU6438824.1 O-antigen ligase family protein [Pantoea sp.]HAT24489.1 ligase [Pantoea septica]